MTLTLSNIPAELNAELQRRAASQRVPIDQVAVEAIRAGLEIEKHQESTDESLNLAAAIRECFAPTGGVDLQIPAREPMREPPAFGERLYLIQMSYPS